MIREEKPELYPAYAKADFNAAFLLAYSKDPTPELIKIAAYHIQQGYEKILKYAVYIKTKCNVEGHHISRLCTLAETYGIPIPPHLGDNARRIGSWAVIGRYPYDINISKEEVTKQIGVAMKFLDYCTEYVKGDK